MKAALESLWCRYNPRTRRVHTNTGYLLVFLLPRQKLCAFQMAPNLSSGNGLGREMLYMKSGQIAAGVLTEPNGAGRVIVNRSFEESEK